MYPTTATGYLLGVTTWGVASLAEQEVRTPSPAVEAVRGTEVEPSCSMLPEVEIEIEIEGTTVGTDGCKAAGHTLAVAVAAAQSSALPTATDLRMIDWGCSLGSVP